LIKGTYRIRRGGNTIAESRNLVTNGGRLAFLRYMAGQIPAWAGAIGVGIGESPANYNDTELEFEIGRREVTILAANPVDDSIVAKTTLGRNVAGEIHELGLFTGTMNFAEDNVDRVLLAFDLDNEPWTTDGTATVADGRVGGKALQLNGTASQTEFFIDLSSYTSSDRMSLAYSGEGVLRLLTESGNYYSVTLPAQDYGVRHWTKFDFAPSGSPDWSHITAFEIEGVGLFDGFRIGDVMAFDHYSLVSRAVLDEPVVKQAGEELDVEYEAVIGV
jgi:hypothetical protein